MYDMYHHGLRVTNLTCVGIEPRWECFAIESSNTVNYATSSFLLYICHTVATYRPRQIFWESCLGHEVGM